MTRVWAKKGSRPVVLRQNGRENSYIFGAANPRTGSHVGLVFSTCDTAAMNLHLSMISSALASATHAILIVDGAGWHSSKELLVPANITLLHLPPYSPELNPIERLWLHVKDRYLSNRLFSDLNEILEAGMEAWRALTDAEIRSICRVSWLPGEESPAA